MPEHPQVIAARTARMEIGRLEHGTDPQRRTRQLRVRMIEHQCSSTRRRCQAQHHPQRRRLASAVRSEKARDRPGLQPK
jgi:hypothetical protein